MPRLVYAMAIVAACSSAFAQTLPEPSVIARVSAYVEAYYARAQSVVARERVTLQPLARDLTSAGFARRLEYELRVDWNPSAAAGEPKATVVRELLSATGPPLGPPDQPECLDPRATTPEPLLFLLPDRRGKYRFTAKSATLVDGRAAIPIEYVPLAPEPPVVTWDDACGEVDLPGRTRGRIWVDPGSGEILRFDERLVGPVDIPAPETRWRRPGPLYLTFERSDTSIRYEAVTFTDPPETLRLPSRLDAVFVIRNSGVPRLRITQEFSDYRRFITESRVLPSVVP